MTFRPVPACVFPYRVRLTMILNDAVPVFCAESVAEHLTTVRPIGNRLPEGGSQRTSTAPSSLSVAVTLYVTRTRFAPLGARTVFEVAPINLGGVRSNSIPGAARVPFHVSVPTPALSERSTVPLPDADWKTPVPPVIVKFCGSFRTGSRSTHWAPSASAN